MIKAKPALQINIKVSAAFLSFLFLSNKGFIINNPKPIETSEAIMLAEAINLNIVVATSSSKYTPTKKMKKNTVKLYMPLEISVASRRCSLICCIFSLRKAIVRTNFYCLLMWTIY